MQSDDSLAVIGEADREADEVAYRLEHEHGRWKNVVQFNSPAIVERQRDWTALQGPHNAQNAAAAMMVCKALGLSEKAIEQGLSTYPGLPHRMEVLGTFNGVLFINDSKATNAASTAPALAAWPPNPDKRLHWICGGLPKADNLDECSPFFGNVAAAYTIGEAGPLFASLLEGHMPVVQCEMLCTAVERAMEAAEPGDVIMLSPACASFDQFRDYEVRGDSFREIVAGLTAK